MLNTADHLSPNEFEIAILARLMPQSALDSSGPAQLRVLKRQLTGAGSYTDFAVLVSKVAESRSHISLDVLIEMPGVSNGLGAVLWLRGGVAECLEIYTYGGDFWDGNFDGYAIVEAA